MWIEGTKFVNTISFNLKTAFNIIHYFQAWKSITCNGTDAVLQFYKITISKQKKDINSDCNGKTILTFNKNILVVCGVPF